MRFSARKKWIGSDTEDGRADKATCNTTFVVSARIAGVAHRKLNGLCLDEIRRRAHREIFLYWVGRFGRFLESGRGKFLQAAGADRCDACLRHSVVCGQGTMAIVASRRCKIGPPGGAANRGAKRRNLHREKSKDRDRSSL